VQRNARVAGARGICGLSGAGQCRPVQDSPALDDLAATRPRSGSEQNGALAG
jgi:hypothetical protein